VTEQEMQAWRQAVESALGILATCAVECSREWRDTDAPELIGAMGTLARAMDYLSHER